MRQLIAILVLAGAPVAHASAQANPEAAALKSPVPAQLTYEAVPMWSQIAERGAPAWEMARVAVSMDGSRIYGFRRSDPSIVEFDRSGKVVRMFADRMFVWPHGLSVDRDGFIWATDGTVGAGNSPTTKELAKPNAAALAGGYGHQVFKFSPDGTIVMTLGKKGVAGDGPDTFNAPTDVAIAPNGDIFVADGHVNARVVKFSKDGRFIKAWGKKGTAPGDFDQPHALAMDSRGRLFVGDRNNKRIQIFDQEGRFLAEWPHPRPSGLAITPDDLLYVSDDSTGVTVFNAKDGAVVAQLSGPEGEGVAADGQGNVYVSEVRKRDLKKYVKR